MALFVTDIALFPSSHNLNGWIACNGALLDVDSNSIFFSILGTRYGGDGRNSFAIPSLDDIGSSHHIILGPESHGQLDFSKIGSELSYLKPSEDDIDDLPLGIITKTDGEVPKNWMLCDGRMLDLSNKKYQSLYSIIGFQFGKNGYEEFALPNLNALGDQKYMILATGARIDFYRKR